MKIENGWTERLKKDALEIENLKAKLISAEATLDAMRGALVKRDEMIRALVGDVEEEKRRNRNWERFAHRAMEEIRSLMEKRDTEP